MHNVNTCAGIPDPQSRQTGSHLQPPPGFDLSDALRKSGVLPHVLRIAAQWPSDDVTHDVAIAAVWVLAHATASSRCPS